jgi:transposase
MPKPHQRHLEWTPSRIISWAQTIGPQTAALVEAILADRPHPEQGYRSCLGILRLAKRYGPACLEAACARAGSVAARCHCAVRQRGPRRHRALEWTVVEQFEPAIRALRLDDHREIQLRFERGSRGEPTAWDLVTSLAGFLASTTGRI